jgi:hypothetical protein
MHFNFPNYSTLKHHNPEGRQHEDFRLLPRHHDPGRHNYAHEWTGCCTTKTVFKTSDVHPAGYPTVVAVENLGKKLDAATNGRYSVQDVSIDVARRGKRSDRAGPDRRNRSRACFGRMINFGVDPVHFGMIMMLNLGIGLCHPPVGAILFVGCAVGKVTIEEVMRKIWPFYAVMFAVLMLVTYIPALSLWLPALVVAH